MREPSFLILTALADGRQHGYAVMKSVEDLSDGAVRLRPGSLYATLDRLADAGLIRGAGEEVVDGRARQYYALTSLGVERLAAEVQRMRANASRAEAGLRRFRANEASA
ncbi:helix-turn-helix transcriptional regulator [Microlunatus elymi]|uniref:Helix-turn-helix transcriptional regulator n=2 Tax=Microlunatus elymi TaxID=2596828 RepID=A0A516Q5K7_9ACTN|nr:helix-turn-helix transcriptional regulator [Microlunatus elymi]